MTASEQIKDTELALIKKTHPSLSPHQVYNEWQRTFGEAARKLRHEAKTGTPYQGRWKDNSPPVEFFRWDVLYPSDHRPA